MKNKKEHDEIFKPIKNLDGSNSKYEVSNKGRIRLIKEKTEVNYINSDTWNSSWTNKRRKCSKNKIRRSVRLVLDDWKFIGSVSRIELMTFKPLSDYSNMEVDHIDENPQNDNLENLQWLLSDENKKKAANFRGRRYTIYDENLIHNICKDILNKTPRKKIKEKYSVPGQLIDDISSGRSHKSISSQYVKDGFVYREYNKKKRQQRQKKIQLICKLIDEGFSNKEIIEMMDLPKNEVCLPNDIRHLRIYKYISKEFNFFDDVNSNNKDIKYDKKENDIFTVIKVNK